MALLQQLSAQGITIVLVTHEPDVAAYASRVVVVRDGKVRADRRQEPLKAVVPPPEEEPLDAAPEELAS